MPSGTTPVAQPAAAAAAPIRPASAEIKQQSTTQRVVAYVREHWQCIALSVGCAVIGYGLAPAAYKLIAAAIAAVLAGVVHHKFCVPAPEHRGPLPVAQPVGAVPAQPNAQNPFDESARLGFMKTGYGEPLLSSIIEQNTHTIELCPQAVARVEATCRIREKDLSADDLLGAVQCCSIFYPVADQKQPEIYDKLATAEQVEKAILEARCAIFDILLGTAVKKQLDLQKVFLCAINTKETANRGFTVHVLKRATERGIAL